MLFDFTSITDNTASYLVIFIYGVVISFHCISMCGGFILSGSILGSFDKKQTFKTPFVYNAGRLISYTLIGGIAGGVGSLFTLSNVLNGALPFISGIFMIIIGLNFIGIFRRLRVNIPICGQVWGKLFKNKNNNMFIVGLGTGILPCGAMQAVQLYSLASGSIIKGALAMLVFCLGTVPMLFSFGYFSSLLKNKFKHYIVKISAVLLIVIGGSMVFRGLSLWGIDTSIIFGSSNYIQADIKNNKQIVITEFDDKKFPDLAFKKGIPAEWVINVDKKYVGECVASIEIDEYDVKIELKEGKNIIQFTPDESGIIVYSSICGMESGHISIQ